MLPSINTSKLESWWTAPLVVLQGTKRINVDNAIDYQSSIPPLNDPKKKILLVANTTSNPRILHTLKHVEKFKLHDLKRFCILIYMRKWDLISFTLQNL